MANYPNRSTEKTALSIKPLQLYAKNSDDKWANMVFNFVTGRKQDPACLDITVWTNVVSDADKSIKASLDFLSIGMFAQTLRNTISQPDGTEYKAPIMDIYVTKWTNKKPDGEYVSTKLLMGKDADGKVWIALASTKQGRPNIKFYFSNNRLRKYVNRDGSPLSDAEHSKLAAQSYLWAIEHVVPVLLVKMYEPEEPSNNGGSSNNNSNQSSSQAQDFDDVF
jgi:hypothetical protein